MARLFSGFRVEVGPKAGDERASPRKCPDCSRLFWQWKRKSTGRCPDCAAVRLVETCSGNSGKVGPAYEKTVRGQLRHWTAEAERLNLL